VGEIWGFGGFIWLVKRAKRWEPPGFFEESISDFPTNRHYPFESNDGGDVVILLTNKRSLREHDFTRLGTKMGNNRLTAFPIHCLLDAGLFGGLIIALYDNFWYSFFCSSVGFHCIFLGGFSFLTVFWVAFEKRWYSFMYFFFLLSLYFYYFLLSCPRFMAAWRFWFQVFFFFSFTFHVISFFLLEWRWNGRRAMENIVGWDWFAFYGVFFLFFSFTFYSLLFFFFTSVLGTNFSHFYLVFFFLLILTL